MFSYTLWHTLIHTSPVCPGASASVRTDEQHQPGQIYFAVLPIFFIFLCFLWGNTMNYLPNLVFLKSIRLCGRALQCERLLRSMPDVPPPRDLSSAERKNAWIQQRGQLVERLCSGWRAQSRSPTRVLRVRGLWDGLTRGDVPRWPGFVRTPPPSSPRAGWQPAHPLSTLPAVSPLCAWWSSMEIWSLLKT